MISQLNTASTKMDILYTIDSVVCDSMSCCAIHHSFESNCNKQPPSNCTDMPQIIILFYIHNRITSTVTTIIFHMLISTHLNFGVIILAINHGNEVNFNIILGMHKQMDRCGIEKYYNQTHMKMLQSGGWERSYIYYTHNFMYIVSSKKLLTVYGKQLHQATNHCSNMYDR